MKKILFCFGTRPEAIKLAPVVKEMSKREQFDVKVCVTAQHRQMLDQVLKLFEIVPDYDLNLMSPNQTLEHLTGIIIEKVAEVLAKEKPDCIIASGGGRKNLSIMKAVNESTNIKCESIEKYGLRGDAIEAEAFAFLAVRSLKKLPLSFPTTTGVKKPLTGGKINKIN